MQSTNPSSCSSVLSARDGLTAEDEEVAVLLRRSSRPVILVANKVDGMDEDTALAGVRPPLAW